MAGTKQDKDSFPTMPTRHWWALRERFKKSIPKNVTANYIATTLSMQQVSAQNNILPSLRAIGLIDADGVPTPVATKWRDDGQYKAVCADILKSVYPDELLDAAPDPNKERSQAQNWFSNHTSVGKNAASKMAAFYALVAQADVTKATESTKEALPSPKTSNKVVPIRKSKPAAEKRSGSARGSGLPDGLGEFSPSININLQIHISADATVEQIDRIFQSMSKHLYDRNKSVNE